MKNNLPKICYWCGIELTSDTQKKEHVPPFTFFPKGFRENLITVPSCFEHNNKYSSLDEKFQIFIKMFGTNEIAINDFNDRVIRGLDRKEKESFVKDLNNKSSVVKINGKRNLLVELDHNESQLFIEKIIRGIYFYHKEKPAKGIIQSVTKFIHREVLNNPAIVEYLLEDVHPQLFTQGYFRNPEVFSYKFLEAQDTFTVIMNFYNEVEFIGWVFPEGFSFD